MSEPLDSILSPQEDRRDVPGETAVPPPGEQVAQQPWEPTEQLARLVKGGVTVTLRITPYLITIWMLGGPELRWEVRKAARWIPWAVRYAGWWLNQRSI